MKDGLQESICNIFDNVNILNTQWMPTNQCGKDNIKPF